MKFGAKAGIISHCKLCGDKDELKVLFVKDCKQLMLYNIKD